MCKEMPVIPVEWVVDKNRIIGKNAGPQGGGEAKGVVDTPPPKKKFGHTSSTLGMEFYLLVIFGHHFARIKLKLRNNCKCLRARKFKISSVILR
jgi:hypothetical protein